MELKIGQPAPLIPDLDFRGLWTLVYFYPRDFTPGCTTEACSFRDNFSLFKNKAVIIGISSDSANSHQKFITKYQLPFRLIADPDKKIITAYGVDGFILPKRTSFLINPQGLIHKIYSGVNPTSHAAQILADL